MLKFYDKIFKRYYHYISLLLVVKLLGCLAVMLGVSLQKSSEYGDLAFNIFMLQMLIDVIFIPFFFSRMSAMSVFLRLCLLLAFQLVSRCIQLVRFDFLMIMESVVLAIVSCIVFLVMFFRFKE